MKSIARSKNIVLHNIPDTEENNKNLFNHVMSILSKIDIQEHHIKINKRIGKHKGKRPVVVNFVAVRYKKIFFDNLEFRIINDHNIVIANETTKEERDEYIKKNLKHEFQKIKIAADLKHNKILVERKYYNSAQAQKLFQEKEKEAGEIEIEDIDSDDSASSVATTKSKKRSRETHPKTKLKC